MTNAADCVRFKNRHSVRNLWHAPCACEAEPSTKSINSRRTLKRVPEPPCDLPLDLHFAVSPVPKVSDGEPFEEGICLYYFFSLGSTRCVGSRHNKGGVGILHC